MGGVQGHIDVIEDGVLLEEEQPLIFDGLKPRVAVPHIFIAAQ